MDSVYNVWCKCVDDPEILPKLLLHNERPHYLVVVVVL